MGNRIILRHDITVEGEHAWCTNGFKRHWDYTGPDPVSQAHLHLALAFRSVECSCEPGKMGAADRNCKVHRG